MHTYHIRPATILVALIAAVAVATVGFAQDQSILDDPMRPAEERERDAGSKPLMVYEFFGVEEGMTVVDLMPGGIFGVVDARTPKEGFDDETHRINQQMVVDHVTAAGFELLESSEMLANPDDDFGEYEGTGKRFEVDRMVLKFRKPTN